MYTIVVVVSIIIINQYYLPYNDTAHAPVATKQHETCAVTLTGKCPLNRGTELQLADLVQDTTALTVLDTETGDE